MDAHPLEQSNDTKIPCDVLRYVDQSWFEVVWVGDYGY